MVDLGVRLSSTADMAMTATATGGLNNLKTAGKRPVFTDLQGCSAILCLLVAAQTGAIGWYYSSGRSREDRQRR
jgi:hypothetical protein